MISNYYLLPEFTPARLQDLVLWLEPWSFRGRTWCNLAPSYSDRNHGTAQGGVGFSTWHPQFPPAPTFNGVDGYVDCGNNPSLPEDTPFTVSVWTKVNAQDDQWRVVTDKYKKSSYATLGIWKSNDNRWSFTTGNGAWHDLKGGSITPGVWYCVVVVWDGTTKYIYVNGELDNSAVPSESQKPCSGAGNLWIGARNINAYYFNGKIDELCIYNRALSPTEIEILYNNYMQKMGSYFNVRKYATPAPVVIV